MKRHVKGLRKLLQALLILCLVGMICYLGIVMMVCWKETHVPPVEDYDAIIVLGAQVKPDGEPSLQLQWRLEAAAKAWKASPCVVVTCGAQGSNEPAPEAHVMRDVLMELGVAEGDILCDASSFNTRQNIENAARLLEGRSVQKVCIVTSDYHLPRAMALAQDRGMEATGMGSPTKLGMFYWVKNHGREALAWCKYWVEKYTGILLD